MIHAYVTPRTLGFVRAWVFGIWLWVIVRSEFYDFGVLPSSIMKLPGIARLVPIIVGPGVLSVPFLYALKYILIVLLILAMLGVKPYRIIAITTAILLTFQQSVIRGVGYSNHSTLAILYAVYILAIFPAADGFTWRKRESKERSSKTYSAALLLITLVMLLTYTAIGSRRLAYSSPEIFLSDSMKYFIAINTLGPREYDPMDFGPLILEYQLLILVLQVGFATTTFFEVLSPLCIIFQRFRYAWLLVIVPFHIASFFLMNIFFWHNLLLIAVTLIDTDYWVTKAKENLRSIRFSRALEQV